MPIFDADTQSQRETAAKKVRSGVKAPYLHVEVSTLGGASRASIIIKTSLDPRSKWRNGILHNSRYSMFHLDRNGTLELFSRSYLLPKMRKSKASSLTDAVQRINKYLTAARKA